MPIPKLVARLNRVGLNRLTRHIAPWAPGFGVVVHQGRRSGRTFQTPVNVFPTSDGVRIALTYGADSDWVKNVLAAGGCRLRTRGHELSLVEPRVVHDPTRTGIRAFERRILGALNVADFLLLTEPHVSDDALQIRQERAMSAFPRIAHVALTVTDLSRSVPWYQRLIGADPVLDEDTGPFRHVVFALGDTLLGLHEFPEGATDAPFDEHRVGLDHVAFTCGDRGQLESWRSRLDDLGIGHGDIVDAGYGSGLSFRDPDNIALEFFAPPSR